MNLIKQSESAMISKQANALMRAAQLVLPLLVLFLWANNGRSYGQQLRDVFRSVQPAVVIVKTEQIGLPPFPQQGLEVPMAWAREFSSRMTKYSRPRIWSSQQIGRLSSSHKVKSSPLK